MVYPVPTKYSNASELRAITLERLGKSLPEYGALPIPVVRLLVDQHLLLENIKRTTFRGKVELVDMSDSHSEFEEEEAASTLVYSDYSFATAPVYKAFEGFLVYLAEVFELPTEKYKHRIGGLYDWEVNKKDEDLIIKSLEVKLGKNREGKDRWRELSMVLRTYRHNPAHYSGDKIKTFEQAEDYARTIINTINQMVKFLIDKGVITSGTKDIDAIIEIN